MSLATGAPADPKLGGCFLAGELIDMTKHQNCAIDFTQL